jgi:hypothetical protein
MGGSPTDRGCSPVAKRRWRERDGMCRAPNRGCRKREPCQDRQRKGKRTAFGPATDDASLMSSCRQRPATRKTGGRWRGTGHAGGEGLRNPITKMRAALAVPRGQRANLETAGGLATLRRDASQPRHTSARRFAASCCPATGTCNAGQRMRYAIVARALETAWVCIETRVPTPAWRKPPPVVTRWRSQTPARTLAAAFAAYIIVHKDE